MKLNLPALEEDDEIDITPMIDCVFLLVLFFMVTSSFIDDPKMPPTPYTLVLNEKMDQEDKTFTVRVEGTYLLKDGDKEEEIPSLAQLTERIRQEPGKKFRVETRSVVQSVDTDKKEEVTVVPLMLPTAEKPTTIRRDQADQLTVPREGALRFQGAGEERTFPNAREMLDWLGKRPVEARKRPVILRVDAKCTFQQVVQARNALRLAGVELIFEEVEVALGKP